MHPFLATACATLAFLPGTVASAFESPAEWRALSERTRARMHEMDETIRDRDPERSYDNYLAMFADDVAAHGLYDTGAADIDGLREHYRPVFFELKDGVLLSDDVIVAGDMAAQRYHSMLYLAGEFDGVEGASQPVFLRGQTFFRFGADNRIAERWSNHDHGYRLGQLKGAAGRTEGERIAQELNGPGLSEARVLERIEDLAAAFNRMEAPAARDSEFFALFDADARVHGIGDGTARVAELRRQLHAFWSAVPDARLIVRASMSAWSMGAFRWTALGSQRGPYRGRAPDMRPVAIDGECIARFDTDGRIVEIWFNTSPPEFDHAN
jgi:hypothetical protein